MLVYHGTTKAVASQAVVDGLHPRGVNTPGTWPRLESNPDFVYMTKAWPLAFAMNAVEKDATEGMHAAILEIDTDLLNEELLRPDEDFLRDYIRILKQLSQPKVKWEPGLADLRERHPEIMPSKGSTIADLSDDLDAMRNHWRKSFELLGTGAYKGTIPANAITRYAIIDPDQAQHLIQYSRLLSVRIMNYLPTSHLHKGLVSLIFDATPLPDIKPKMLPSQDARARFNRMTWGTKELKSATESERELSVQILPRPALSEAETEGAIAATDLVSQLDHTS